LHFISLSLALFLSQGSWSTSVLTIDRRGSSAGNGEREGSVLCRQRMHRRDASWKLIGLCKHSADLQDTVLTSPRPIVPMPCHKLPFPRIWRTCLSYRVVRNPSMQIEVFGAMQSKLFPARCTTRMVDWSIADISAVSISLSVSETEG
jgi:hypothetical protein